MEEPLKTHEEYLEEFYELVGVDLNTDIVENMSVETSATVSGGPGRKTVEISITRILDWTDLTPKQHNAVVMAMFVGSLRW
jgi:hypothetical protein